MGFNSSGVFTRTNNDKVGGTVWQDDAASSIKIRADRHDFHDQDIANGLTQCITKTGNSLPTANIPMGGFSLTGLKPTAGGDPSTNAATNGYVDNPGAWTTSRTISGNDANAKLTFSGATGVNGICWNPNINMSIVSKPAVLTPVKKSPDAIAFNNNGSGTGTNVAFIDKSGRLNLNSGQLCYNLVHDGTNWHAPATGFGAIAGLTGQALSISSNDTSVAQDDDNVTTRAQFQWTWSSG